MRLPQAKWTIGSTIFLWALAFSLAVWILVIYVIVHIVTAIW